MRPWYRSKPALVFLLCAAATGLPAARAAQSARGSCAAAARAATKAAGGTRTLLEIELWEISVVTFPLLAGSEVTAIGKASDVMIATDAG